MLQRPGNIRTFRGSAGRCAGFKALCEMRRFAFGLPAKCRTNSDTSLTSHLANRLDCSPKTRLLGKDFEENFPSNGVCLIKGGRPLGVPVMPEHMLNLHGSHAGKRKRRNCIF